MRIYYLVLLFACHSLLHAQNVGTISITENNILYRGYDTRIEVGLNKYCDDSIWVECTDCDSVINMGHRSYLVRPSKSRNITLSVFSSIGDSVFIVLTKRFWVSDLPDPKVSFDIFRDGEAISVAKLTESLKRPQYSDELPSDEIRTPRFYARYGSDRAMATTFSVIKWRVKINSSVFEGRGSNTNSALLDELMSLKFKEPVFMKTETEVMGPDAKKRLITSIFEVVP